MENFSVLGALALQLHQEFVNVYYLILPVFFALALAIDWFRNPSGSPDFLDTLKRAIVATLLVVGFREISETILALTAGIAEKISDMSGIDAILKMAGDKCRSYPLSPMSLVLGFDDLVVAILSFLSYVVLYFARFISVALYHFMWIFLSILAPLLISLNIFRGTQGVTVSLFRSLVEVASWKIAWAVMSAMITALSFGNTYAADGNYLTVIILNFVIAIAMLGTPMIVKSLVGGGLTSMSQTLGMGAALAMASAPAKGASLLKLGKEVASDTKGYGARLGGSLGTKMWEGIRNPNPPPPLVPPRVTPIIPESHQLPAPPIYLHAPSGYHGESPS